MPAREDDMIEISRRRALIGGAALGGLASVVAEVTAAISVNGGYRASHSS